MEHWHETYTSDVDIYEAFAAACDPEGLVWHRVLETIPFADKTVLEIGCGLGHYAQAIAPTTTSYSADNSPEMIEAVRTELEPAYRSWGMFAEWLPLNIEGLLRIWAETGATGATPAH